MSNFSVTPPPIRDNKNTLTSCLNLPGIGTEPPSPAIDVKPLIELSNCKSFNITTSSGNRYGQDMVYPTFGNPQYPNHNHNPNHKTNDNSDRFYFLIGCIVALVILMLLTIIGGYWALNHSKTYSNKSESDKEFLKRCVLV